MNFVIDHLSKHFAIKKFCEISVFYSKAERSMGFWEETVQGRQHYSTV